MKNKILYIFLFIILNNLTYLNTESAEQFNFNVTEIQILEDGNLIKGLKKGSVNTNDGIKISADTFIYNKISNILTANGNVEIIDDNQNLKIYSENAVYQKNQEILTTTIDSKAVYETGKLIFADTFEFNRNENILNAKGNVKIEDTINNYLIEGNDFTYYKTYEKIITKGATNAFIKSKYKINSEDVMFLINENVLSSKKRTKIEDQDSQVYFIEKFDYSINTEILKGEKIIAITNYNLPKSDKFFLKNAIINLKDRSFLAKDTKIKIHNDIFNNSENDPRLKGVSSSSENEITTISKGIFTSCKKDDNCPPWAIKAQKITHDRTKKQLIYDNAILQVYDIPVLYFPKFFHPDPSVKRQSGLLKPTINNSNVLGSSITIPYFKILSDDKDFTFKPTWFDNKILMSQNEFRKTDDNYNFIADFSYVDGYQSSITNKKKNLSHLFVNFDNNLNLENFNRSDLVLSIEKVTNDTYLKIFDTHVTKSSSRPSDFNNLNNHLKLFLNHEKFNFESGVETYENLQASANNDKYQYILPYYNFDTILDKKYFNGSINFSSNGSNTLQDTNNLKSNIINNLTYYSQDFISNLGIKQNFDLNIKNLNSIGKKNPNYKSNPQLEIVTLLNAEASFPLVKNDKNHDSYLTPKISFKFNPNDMKNYTSSDNKIDIGNIFATNRLGLADTFEAGRSLTLGIDYKKENLDAINKYFEIKLATVLRDKEEKFIPSKSTINRKTSNLFGSLSTTLSDNLQVNYNFAIDNDYNNFEYNDFNATFSVNNIITQFNFIEESGEMGDANVIENTISYKLNNENHFSFNTRRNRKINLTEYYNLVYEYKNDCLTAGIKYKKSYYQDRDLKPTEDLFFTVTLFPLTTYEYDADDLITN